jgi:transposase-like protein
MVQKMTGPDAIAATALSKQVDVPQTTLSKWLRNAGIEPSFGFPNNAANIRGHNIRGQTLIFDLRSLYFFLMA